MTVRFMTVVGLTMHKDVKCLANAYNNSRLFTPFTGNKLTFTEKK
jgi:hypothetical protein